MLLTAGAVVLIPDAPLVTITMFVQVVAVTLLPSLLVFLLLMLNDEGHDGRARQHALAEPRQRDDRRRRHR